MIQRSKLQKLIKGKYYFRLPDIIADSLKLSNEDKVELTIHNKKNQDQVDLWDVHPEDINSINFNISKSSDGDKNSNRQCTKQI